MIWFKKPRLTAAEALELELEGIATNSSAAELLRVTDALHAAAHGLPAPSALRARRAQLLAMVAPAQRVKQGGAPVGRHVPAMAFALALATVTAAGVVGSTLLTSWPDSGSTQQTTPVNGAGASDETPEPSHAQDSELPASLHEACGQEVVLPDLSALDEAAAQALVDALIEACEAAQEASEPGETPEQIANPQDSELLARLREACGPEVVLPDLSALDEAAAQALVEALIEVCDAAPPTLGP